MCNGHVTRESVLLQLQSLVFYLNPSKVAERAITWFSGFSYLTGNCVEHFLYCSELGNCVVFSLKTTQWTCIRILSLLLYTRNAYVQPMTFSHLLQAAVGKVDTSKQMLHRNTLTRKSRTPFSDNGSGLLAELSASLDSLSLVMSSRIFFNSTIKLSTSDDGFPVWSADIFLLPLNSPAVCRGIATTFLGPCQKEPIIKEN